MFWCRESRLWMYEPRANPKKLKEKFTNFVICMKNSEIASNDSISSKSASKIRFSEKSWQLLYFFGWFGNFLKVLVGFVKLFSFEWYGPCKTVHNHSRMGGTDGLLNSFKKKTLFMCFLQGGVCILAHDLHCPKV